MDNYIIWLEGKDEEGNEVSGYWNGKEYIRNKIKYPKLDKEKGFRNKLYYNEKVAKNGLYNCMNKYKTMYGGKVEVLKVEVRTK